MIITKKIIKKQDISNQPEINNDSLAMNNGNENIVEDGNQMKHVLLQSFEIVQNLFKNNNDNEEKIHWFYLKYLAKKYKELQDYIEANKKYNKMP